MGAYINPPNRSTDAGKIAWLHAHGKPLTREQAVLHDDFEDNFLIAVSHNYHFITCGIAFDKREKETFLDESDMRPRAYFVVPKEELLKVSNLSHYLKKEG